MIRLSKINNLVKHKFTNNKKSIKVFTIIAVLILFTTIYLVHIYTSFFGVLAVVSQSLFSSDKIEQEDGSSCSWEVRVEEIEGIINIGSSTDNKEVIGETGALIGESAIQQIWNYLRSKGYGEVQTAGIMGNLAVESGYSSINLQNSFEKKLGMSDEQYTKKVDSGEYKNFISDSAGYGLCQWTFKTRKENLYKFAKERGVSIGDLKMQLDFMLKEVSQYESDLGKFRSTNSIDIATEEWEAVYERAGKPNLSKRKKEAHTAYNICKPLEQISGNNKETILSTTKQEDTEVDKRGVSGLWKTLLSDVSKHNSSEEWTKLVSDVGKAPLDGDKINMEVDKFKGINGIGVVRYMQNRSGGTSIGTYATNMYNKGSTFSESGCGVCATAIVLSTLTGKYVNPAEVALAAMTYGDRNIDKSASNIFSANATNVITDEGIKLLCSEAGMKAELGGFDKTKLNSCLSSNGMVIAVFKGDGFSAGNSGHYVVIREQDTNDSNNYYLVQSASFDVDNKPFSFETIERAIKLGGHPNVVYIYPNSNLLNGANENGSSNSDIGKGKRYILYHSGDKDCKKHNGYYCSCGVKYALDIRKEYILYEEDLGNILISENEVPNKYDIEGISIESSSNFSPAMATEIHSAVVMLKYYGLNTSANNFYNENVVQGVYGLDSPYEKYIVNEDISYGCYSSVIVSSLQNYLEKSKSNLSALDLTGKDLSVLIDTYVSKGNPIAVYVTSDLQEPAKDILWNIKGENITWSSNKNCVLITGYDKEANTITVLDSNKGSKLTYDMSIFESIYTELGKIAFGLPKEIDKNSSFDAILLPFLSKDLSRFGFSSAFVDSNHTNPYHKAIDFGNGGKSVPITSVWDGEIVFVGNSGSGTSGYGYVVVVKHNVEGKTIFSKYNHMVQDSCPLKKGDKVKAGEKIGMMGGTANKTNTNVYAIHLDLQMAMYEGDYNYSSFKSNLINPMAIYLGWANSVDELTIFKADGKSVKKKGEDVTKSLKKYYCANFNEQIQPSVKLSVRGYY